MSASEQGALPLPGMDDPRGDGGALELAVRRTIDAHFAAGNLAEVDAGKCAIALELCAVAVAKRQQRRLSTVANDLRLLSELLDSMAPQIDGDADQRLRNAMDEWAAYLRAQGIDPTAEVQRS